MSQVSTASKLNQADLSNDELVQLVSESDIVPSSSNLTSQEECLSSRGRQGRISYYSVGCDIYDDYSDNDDEASVEDRLDFGRCKVPGWC